MHIPNTKEGLELSAGKRLELLNETGLDEGGPLWYPYAAEAQLAATDGVYASRADAEATPPDRAEKLWKARG